MSIDLVFHCRLYAIVLKRMIVQIGNEMDPDSLLPLELPCHAVAEIDEAKLILAQSRKKAILKAGALQAE